MEQDSSLEHGAELVKNCKKTGEIFLKYANNDVDLAEALVEKCFQEIYMYIEDKYQNLGIDLMREFKGDLYLVKGWIISVHEGTYSKIEDFVYKYIKNKYKISDGDPIFNYINNSDYAFNELIYPHCNNGKYLAVGGSNEVHIFKYDESYAGLFDSF